MGFPVSLIMSCSELNTPADGDVFKESFDHFMAMVPAAAPVRDTKHQSAFLLVSRYMHFLTM